MSLLGDLLSFGYIGNNHFPITIIGKQCPFGVDERECFSDSVSWKNRSAAPISEGTQGLFPFFLVWL